VKRVTSTKSADKPFAGRDRIEQCLLAFFGHRRRAVGAFLDGEIAGGHEEECVETGE
jgi:hypothetical protein